MGLAEAGKKGKSMSDKKLGQQKQRGQEHQVLCSEDLHSCQDGGEEVAY